MSNGQRPVPSTLGRQRYTLGEPLGSGGMAVVYRALDRWNNDACAIKLLLPHASQSDKTRSRFLHEARTMAALDHVNVIRVRDVGEEDGQYYFAMELAAGGSVADLVRRHGARRPHEALGYVLDVLKGLEYAHVAGVVHRDVKPHNMLLDAPWSAENPQPRVKLTDFGIARLVAAPTGSRITGTGDTLGTLAYMSPEQRVDPRNAGPESDVYGVGATLYILVTGRRPFDLAVAHQDPSVHERVPEPLREIVRKSTMPRPADRYRTAREMGAAVAAVMGQLDPAFEVASALDAFAMDGSDTIVAPHTQTE